MASPPKYVPAVLSAALLFAAALFPPTARTALPHRPLLSGAGVPPQLHRVLERSCQDCHSDNTRWPWYTQLPPASWLIERDVAHGRAFMNLSHWETYPKASRLAFLAGLASVARDHTMPPHRYCLVHPGACPDNADRAALASWARHELALLRTHP